MPHYHWQSLQSYQPPCKLINTMQFVNVCWKKCQETITACSLKMQQESAVKETKKFYENTNDNLNYVHLIEEKTYLR